MKMYTKLLSSALMVAGLSGVNAQAQDAWPARPITYVAAFPAGSNTDTLGRIIAQKLSEALKVPVIVDNRAGATGMVGSAYVAKAPPDGYTLLGASIASHAINPSMFPNMQYDPIKSFEPITIIGMNANVLVVPASSPYKSVADIIAAAKADPGTLSYASSGLGHHAAPVRRAVPEDRRHQDDPHPLCAQPRLAGCDRRAGTDDV